MARKNSTARKTSPAKFQVRLHGVPNPDFGQFGSIGLEPQWVDVKDLKDASATCRAFIQANALGGGNWPGGLVRDESGNTIAVVSYNGRIWEPGPFPQKEIIP